MRSGINTIGKLHRAVKDGSVWQVRNMGVKGVAEVEEKLEKFIASISYSENNPTGLQSSGQLAAETGSQPNFEMDLIADLSLHLLPAYITKDQASKLTEAGIETIGQLNSIFQNFQDFIYPSQMLPIRVINLLKSRLGKQVREGSLSTELLVGGQSLVEYLNYTPADPQDIQNYILALKPLVVFDNLEQELGYVFSNLTPREETLYLKYHLKNMTLESLGQEENVTRERIRQIISNARTKILGKLSYIRRDYIITALNVAEQLEGGLSKARWKAELQNNKLLEKQSSSKTIDRLLATLSDKNLPGELFKIPTNVALILNRTTDIPVFVMRAIKDIPKEKFREIDRIVKYTAGIQKEMANEILGCKPEELSAILAHRGLEEVETGWFSIREIPEKKSKQPLLEAGLRMWHTCGSLEFGTFFEGLQRYVSRHYDALAPAEIVVHYLEKIGFKIEERRVLYKGEETARLSGAEEIAVNIIDDLGPVVSFLELVDGFLAKGYSAASATTKVMKESAVVERIELGFYKKRGVPISEGDLEVAKSRQETADREPAILITSDGKVRYQTTVNTWALGGVLSIGKLSEYLPDLSDGCPVYVGDKECGNLTRSENLIWGLTNAFNELEIKFGDYIELEFDKKKPLKAQVNMLQRRAENPTSSSDSETPVVVENEAEKESQLEIVLRFLRQLHERAKNRTPLHAKVKLGYHNSFGVSAGKSGLRYGYIVVMDRGIVNLYIDNGDKEWNKDEFTRLYEHKTKIEEVFGEKLEWHLMPEQKSSYIRFTVSGYNLRSKDTWIEFQDKLIDAMIRLERAFRPFIKE
jgi:hypothetical protein